MADCSNAAPSDGRHSAPPDAIGGDGTSQDPRVSNVTQSVPRVSFAAAVSRTSVVRPRFPDLQIPNRQYGNREGVPCISFSAQEIQAASDRFRHTLIAKFQAGRPSMDEIKRFFASNWHIKGRGTISANWDDRHVVVILDSDEDVNTALTCPHRKIGLCYFRLFRWSADYNPKKESSKITKWLRLPGLPMQLYDRGMIRAIVSSFSDFLDVDDKTKELSALNFARVCVEIDVLKPIPSRVWINLPEDKGFFQEIVIEGGISYCVNCRLHGHDMQTCRKKKSVLRSADNSKDDDNRQGENMQEKEPTVMAAGHQGAQNQWQGTKKSYRNRGNKAQNKKAAIGETSNSFQVLEGVENSQEEMELESTGKEIVVYQESVPKGDILIREEESYVATGGIVMGVNDKETNAFSNEEMGSIDLQREGCRVDEVEVGLGVEVPVPFPEDIAQKVTSYGSKIFCYDTYDAPVDAVTFYLRLKAKYDDAFIFQVMDDIVTTQAQKEGASSSIEVSDGSVDLSRILKKPRQKTKGTRHSGRSRPKKKDPSFVY